MFLLKSRTLPFYHKNRIHYFREGFIHEVFKIKQYCLDWDIFPFVISLFQFFSVYGYMHL